jgi:hypothetical protein
VSEREMEGRRRDARLAPRVKSRRVPLPIYAVRS